MASLPEMVQAFEDGLTKKTVTLNVSYAITARNAITAIERQIIGISEHAGFPINELPINRHAFNLLKVSIMKRLKRCADPLTQHLPETLKILGIIPIEEN